MRLSSVLTFFVLFVPACSSNSDTPAQPSDSGASQPQSGCTASAGGPTLAACLARPIGVFVDGTSVYWVEQLAGTISKMPKDGSGAPTVLASGISYPFAVVADADNVYFTVEGSAVRGDGMVMSVPQNGGDTRILASKLADPHEILLDGASIYFVERGVSTGDGKVDVVPKDGSAPAAVAVNYLHAPVGLAVDATNIYVAEGTGGNILMQSKPLGSASPIKLATRQGRPIDLDIDGTYVYWANQLDGSINRVPIAGGAPTQVAAGHVGIGPITVVADGVYFGINASGGAVKYVPFAGGDAAVLADGEDYVASIAVDGDSVYFASNTTTGALGKVARH